eukprot:g2994.t1
MMIKLELARTNFSISAQQRPNVLILVVDDLRPELGAFGASHVHSPNLDALARRSLVLEANYVQVPVCGPTRASFLTGRRPDTLRTVAHTATTPQEQYWRMRAGNYTTLPQMFKQAGWYTTSVGKTFDLRTSSFNTSAEWICDGPYSWSEPTQYCGTALWTADAQLSGGQSHKRLSNDEEARHSDVRITAAAIARLNVSVGALKERISSPLISALSRARATAPPPLSPTSTFRELSRLDWNDPQHVLVHGDSHHVDSLAACEALCTGTPECTGAVGQTMREDRAAELKRYYYAAVSHTDELVGAVLEAVRARGDENNTVVALLGDHGWHLDEQGMFAKCTLFEAGTRAPMLIAVPGVTDAGHRSTQLTEHVDLLPTLAAAAGLPVPARCPGDGGGTAAQPALCTEGVNVLPLVHAGRGGDGHVMGVAASSAPLRKAAFSQWPHPFCSRPAAMGYSIRVTQPANARYTEWVLMSYGNSTPGRAGAHTPLWNRRCARELYIYGSSNGTAGGGGNGTWRTGAEVANVADDPAHAALAETLRAHLYAGWRTALGPGQWPPIPKLPPPVEFAGCPMTAIPVIGEKL